MYKFIALLFVAILFDFARPYFPVLQILYQIIEVFAWAIGALFFGYLLKFICEYKLREWFGRW